MLLKMLNSKRFLIQNIDGFDVENEIWKFHSRYAYEVGTNAFDGKLKANSIFHLEYAVFSLRDPDFRLSFHAICRSDLCKCEVFHDI